MSLKNRIKKNSSDRKNISEKKLNYREITAFWEKRVQEDTVDVDKKDPFWGNYERKFVEGRVSPNDIVLDVGCGTGRMLEVLLKQDCKVYGIDYTKAGVEHCKKRFPELEITRGLAQKLPYKNSFFDKVVSIRVLQSMPTREMKQKALKEMVRVVKQNGLIILVEGNSERTTKHPSYNHYLSEKEWTQIFDRMDSVVLEEVSGIPLATLLTEYDRAYLGFQIRSEHAHIYKKIYKFDKEAGLTPLRKISHQLSYVLRKR